jgi:hypothetical protein
LVCPPGSRYVSATDAGTLNGACAPCAPGTYADAAQPLDVLARPAGAPSPARRLDDGSLAAVCEPCPALPSAPGFGSYFTSASPVIYADWGRVFTGITPGVDRFAVAVGTALGGGQVLPLTDVGFATAAALPLPPATTPEGVPLFVTVAVTDAFGRSTVYTGGQPVALDTSAPLAGRAVDGTPDVREPNAALGFQDGWTPEESAALRALPVALDQGQWREAAGFLYISGVRDAGYWGDAGSWNITFEPFRDPGSAIVAAAVCLGTSPGACDAVPRQPADALRSVTLATLAGLTLAHGTTYYATAWAVNAVGLVASVTTSGALVITEPPTPGIVGDGPGGGGASLVPRDVDCALLGAPLAASWAGFSSLATLDAFAVGWGSAPGRDDVVPLRNVGLVYAAAVDAATAAAATLPAGVTLYATVTAVGTNGMNATASSDGVLLLCPPPDASADELAAVLGGTGGVASVAAAAAAAGCPGWVLGSGGSDGGGVGAVAYSAAAHMGGGFRGLDALCIGGAPANQTVATWVSAE